MRKYLTLATFACLLVSHARADEPVAAYMFPAGGQRGQTVNVKVGGLFLHRSCAFAISGPGVKATPTLKSVPTLWFEGPMLAMPASQRKEDYPKDLAGQIAIAANAAPGSRRWYVKTSQGVTPSMKFMVGDYPEIVETELDGDAVPVPVKLPVTINGRIFPREDVDLWTFHARKGQTISCDVHAARLMAPLDARIEILDAQGRRLAESEDAVGSDPRLRFTAPADGDYQVRIQDTTFQGGQDFVYRLTLTDDPFVERFFPLGGRQGSMLTLNLGESTTTRVQLPADHAGTFRIQPNIAGKLSANTIALDVDNVPEFLESKQTHTLPAMFNGRIQTPGETDAWTWQAKKGTAYVFALRAGQLGSPLDGVLTIRDQTGKQLARAETSKPGELDPELLFTAPADGNYLVEVQDRFRSRAGDAFAYRLRAAPALPDFRLSFDVDAVSVFREVEEPKEDPKDKKKRRRARKVQAKLRVNIDRLGGFEDAVDLKFENLPTGITIEGNATIAVRKPFVDVVLKAAMDAPIEVAEVAIIGSSTRTEMKNPRAKNKKVPEPKDTDYTPIVRRAQVKAVWGEPTVETLRVAVAMTTPFKIVGDYEMGFGPRGSVQKRHYKIERNGYDGPIEISLADRQARHLQGATGPSMIIPPNVNEFDYDITLPPWMESGRTCRVCVMGFGVVKDEAGKEHRVSYSSVQQNEQFISVVGPGKIALATERQSFLAMPGKDVACKLSVKRAVGFKGPVTLALIVPAHLTGLKATPATIPAGRDDGEIIIHFDDRLPGPFNMPVTIEATLLHEGLPYRAEAQIEIVPEKK